MLKGARNILIITGWSFEDALIQAYTLPYIEIIKKNLPEGSIIYLYTQQKKSYYSNFNENEKQKKALRNSNIYVLSSKYRNFGLISLFFYYFSIINLSIFCFFKKIKVIHTWCTPAGGMGYLISIITGKKIILDSFEPHALSMLEGNTWSSNSIAFKLLFWLEKKQLQRASEVICAAEGMIEYSQEIYKIRKERYFTKPACVNLSLFSKQKIKQVHLVKGLNLDGCITCVYAGKFGGLYLEKETFDFFKIAYSYWGDKFRVLLLTSHSDVEIENYINAVQLPKNILIKKFVKHNEIPDYMGVADFAICPMKPLPSRRYCTPIKNGEYWALGLPIVITKNISDDSRIVKENKIGSILDELNDEAYLKSVKEIDELLKNNSGAELYNKIRPIAEKYRNFSIAEKAYKVIYNNK